MRILMLGWEFPPHISGGLGTACYGLTKGLSRLGAEVLFALPRPVASALPSHVKFVAPSRSLSASDALAAAESLANVKIRPIDARLYPYAASSAQLVPVGEGRAWALGSGPALASATALQYSGQGSPLSAGAAHAAPIRAVPDDPYGRGLFFEVSRYVDSVCCVAAEEAFDLVHAHDWMTFPAAAAVARQSGKPLVVHVHSTEFDRSGEGVNPQVYEIERAGMHAAHKVIAVSRRTKRICTERYGVPEEKVCVVYNAVEHDGWADPEPIASDDKVVLFLGRITMQKGPEYFVAAARRVLEKVPEAKFIMAGAGDKMNATVELAAHMGIGHRVLFTGFLAKADVARAFRRAAVYVMPSVSEPFGITPLEALASDVPVIISKQSGVAEVLRHALKVDFWDIDEMANKIVAVLSRPALRETLRQNGSSEAKKFDWTLSARRCLDVYSSALAFAPAAPMARAG
jgi:glycosyltransferase involved in cell wall biosynthesis